MHPMCTESSVELHRGGRKFCVERQAFSRCPFFHPQHSVCRAFAVERGCKLCRMLLTACEAGGWLATGFGILTCQAGCVALWLVVAAGVQSEHAVRLVWFRKHLPNKPSGVPVVLNTDCQGLLWDVKGDRARTRAVQCMPVCWRGHDPYLVLHDRPCQSLCHARDCEIAPEQRLASRLLAFIVPYLHLTFLLLWVGGPDPLVCQAAGASRAGPKTRVKQRVGCLFDDRM
mmetsp:Transcript_2206/g.5608  ORF Transcript_2206/g.5608 Transcript_2206/m.5608 type:complete len:229 (+) Transcript_2206:2264-2950(+)